jgi:hypothetical protein
MPRPTTTEIEVDTVTVETDKAILCVIDDKEVWIPKSQVDQSSDVQSKGDSGTLVIPEWLAIEKRLV